MSCDLFGIIEIIVGLATLAFRRRCTLKCSQWVFTDGEVASRHAALFQNTNASSVITHSATEMLPDC